MQRKKNTEVDIAGGVTLSRKSEHYLIGDAKYTILTPKMAKAPQPWTSKSKFFFLSPIDYSGAMDSGVITDAIEHHCEVHRCNAKRSWSFTFLDGEHYLYR